MEVYRDLSLKIRLFFEAIFLVTVMLLGDTGNTPIDTTSWEKLVKVLQDEEKWKLIIEEFSTYQHLLLGTNMQHMSKQSVQVTRPSLITNE